MVGDEGRGARTNAEFHHRTGRIPHRFREDAIRKPRVRSCKATARTTAAEAPPNGQQIDDTKGGSSTKNTELPVRFVKNRIAQLRLGMFRPDANSGPGRSDDGWTLTVTRRIE